MGLLAEGGVSAGHAQLSLLRYGGAVPLIAVGAALAGIALAFGSLLLFSASQCCCVCC